MDTPTVSIIIPTYNSAKYIAESIESALSQTYKDYEIIVVDDGSTDNTKDVLKLFENVIRYIYKENGGPASARNVGIKAAKGKYIAFLDSDDVWLPEKLKLQVEYLETHPNVDLVYSDPLRMNSEGEIIPTPKIKNRNPSDIFYHLFEENVIPTLTVVVRKKCFDKVGLFDESLIRSSDFDMWLRIARHCEIWYFDKVLAKYRFHQGGISKNIDKASLSRKNIIDTHIKNLREAGQYTKALEESVNRGLFRLFFTWGRDYLGAGELKKARNRFRNAMQYNTLSLSNYIYYLATFMNLSTIKFIKRFKRLCIDSIRQKER